MRTFRSHCMEHVQYLCKRIISLFMITQEEDQLSIVESLAQEWMVQYSTVECMSNFAIDLT